jgi:hypothetical protein
LAINVVHNWSISAQCCKILSTNMIKHIKAVDQYLHNVARFCQQTWLST